MSRVAKAPIQLPPNVEFNLNSDGVVVKGPKGSLELNYKSAVNISVTKSDAGRDVVLFNPETDSKDAWSYAGTTRALVNNMIKGVTEGYAITLELVGVGYRAQINNKNLVLSLGYSHPVEYLLPEGISAEVPNNTTIVLRGIDNQLVGQVAAEIRSLRPPEPYKGKGVKYAGEVIIRKEAKKK